MAYNFSNHRLNSLQLIVVLGPLLLGSVKEWIKNLWPSPHLICIEKPPELVKNEHVLMVGVGTDNDDCKFFQVFLIIGSTKFLKNKVVAIKNYS